jgi:hypothetical protein
MTLPIVTFPHHNHSLATAENLKDIRLLLRKGYLVMYEHLDSDGNQRWKPLPIQQKGIFVG